MSQGSRLTRVMLLALSATLTFAVGLISAPAFAQTEFAQAESTQDSTQSAPPDSSSSTSAPVDEAAAATPEATNEFDLFQLDQYVNNQVTTASGAAEDRSLAPANVTSIDKDEIARRGYRSLAEVLSQVTGLYVVDDLVLPSLSVRGVSGGLHAGTRLVKVMIDGVQVNFRPELTAFIGPEYIPMEAIERIEVARGPLSAIYGANAFLATVNVITKRPSVAEGTTATLALRSSLIRNQSVRPGGSTSFSYGSDHWKALAAVTTDTYDRSGLAISQTFDRQKNLSDWAFVDGKSTTNDFSAPVSAFAMASYESEKFGRLTIEGGVQRIETSANFQFNSYLTNKSTVSLTNWWGAAKYEKSLHERVNLEVNFNYGNGAPNDEYRVYNTDHVDYSFRPRYDYWAAGGSIIATIKPIDTLSIRLGIDGDYDDEGVLFYERRWETTTNAMSPGQLEDFGIGTAKRRQQFSDMGAFLQAGGNFIPMLDKLFITGNARIDRIVAGAYAYPVQFSWRAALAYRFSEKFTLKAVGGQAFQAPSGVLLYAVPDPSTFGNLTGNVTDDPTRVNNPAEQLRPQRITSAEIVGVGSLFDRLVIDLGAYFQTVNDKIAFTKLGIAEVATNQGVASGMGVEGNLRLVFERAKPYVNSSLFIPIGPSVANDPKSPFAPSLTPTASYPVYFGSAGIDVDIPEAYLRLNAQVRGSTARGANNSNVVFNNRQFYTLKPYWLVDVGLSTNGLKVLGDRQETRFTLTVRNLLDQRYTEPGFGGYDIPNVGRTFLLEVRQQF